VTDPGRRMRKTRESDATKRVIRFQYWGTGEEKNGSRKDGMGTATATVTGPELVRIGLGYISAWARLKFSSALDCTVWKTGLICCRLTH
jgi:hypothetical protein